MKKILIFSHGMELGGAERALCGMLENIDTDKYEVDLFLMRHEGELMPYIPKNINLLPEIPRYACLAVPIGRVLKGGHFLIALGRLVGKIKANRYVKAHPFDGYSEVPVTYSHKYTLPFMPKISDKEYDLAISFLTPHYFVSERVSAKKKVAWIHTDYASLGLDRETELHMWEKYDRIGSITDYTTERFADIFPELKSKVETVENMIPTEFMRKMTSEFDASAEMPNDGSVRLLSIGRFCYQKNFNNVPDICRRLNDMGHNVKWYLLGYGKDEELIREKISEAHMEENVVILGKKTNPYPYIKSCDIYVQPSRYEGKCLAVVEAQMLGKPTVITESFAGAATQLIDGYNGVVVPFENEGCAEGIAALISNGELLAALAENTQKDDFSNKGEIEKIYGWISED